MAAYGALVSVMNIIETIKNHPRPPISFDEEQLHSLTENITFLQEFLETHSVDDDDFEGRIADAAYEAEDVIESYIVDQILASTTDHEETIRSCDFYDGLHKVIQDLDLIQTDTTGFAKKIGIKDDDDQLRRSHSSTGRDTAVGLDDVLVEVMNKLTGHQSNRQIIPIVGMGGIGKTTLASNIYVNPVIVQYFDFRGWATISQGYNSKEIILEVLLCLNRMERRQSLSGMTEDELGVKLYKSLCGRRYLIVLDDIWSIEAWDKVKTFFPNNKDGSAIMLTTRLSNLAFQLSDSSVEMSFLDEDKSWNLFCKTTFGEESCPPQLEGIGKKIVENCKGLPLTIVVVGGLLAKSERKRKYWLYIAENLNSVVNSEDDKRCLKILHLSYKELPVHLKPCFLYMGVYPEDFVIHVPDLMRLWVAEGFLKPIGGKCLEIVAKEYFNDLLGRNLILVDQRGDSGETITCKVHDLLVDVCVKEAEKHKFLNVASHYNLSNPQEQNTLRRVVVHDGIRTKVIHDAFASHETLLRSLTCKDCFSFPESLNSRLLRVCNGYTEGQYFPMFHFLKNTRGTNCRYICIPLVSISLSKELFSVLSTWNLQTLYVHHWNKIRISAIWEMSQLRHVRCTELELNPPNDEGDDFVLGNLQTLSTVINFEFSEDVVKRIPNIKELGVRYENIIDDWSSYCLNNLVQLINLECLSFQNFSGDTPLSNLTFPHSLKELGLRGTRFESGDLGTKIGSLPNLQVLKLKQDSFVGAEWDTVEGQFPSLEYLEISDCYDFKYWRTESCTHFPCLENLALYNLTKLEAIPLEIGETLKSIDIRHCNDNVIFSAKEMLMEQEDLGNEGLHVKVVQRNSKLDVVNMVAPNFQVHIFEE